MFKNLILEVKIEVLVQVEYKLTLIKDLINSKNIL